MKSLFFALALILTTSLVSFSQTVITPTTFAVKSQDISQSASFELNLSQKKEVNLIQKLSDPRKSLGRSLRLERSNAIKAENEKHSLIQGKSKQVMGGVFRFLGLYLAVRLAS